MLVFQYKLISYEYFLDSLKEYEINDLLEGINYVDRVSWEQTRIGAYLSMLPHCKKLDMKKMLPFKWDDEEIVEKDTTITNEDIKRLTKKIKEVENMYNSK